MGKRIAGFAGLAVLTVSGATALELRDAHRMTPESGWALAGDHLLWTTSAGFQWTDITPLPTGRGIYGVFFLNASSGWLLRQGEGAALELARTTDAGARWSLTPFPLSSQDAAHFGGRATLHFGDALHGAITLRMQSSSNFNLAILFTTSDGGASWTRVPGAIPQPHPPAAAPGDWVITQEGQCAGFKTNCTQQYKLLSAGADITPPIASGITPESTGVGMGQ